MSCKTRKSYKITIELPAEVLNKLPPSDKDAAFVVNKVFEHAFGKTTQEVFAEVVEDAWDVLYARHLNQNGAGHN